jgi:hypothetical protein
MRKSFLAIGAVTMLAANVAHAAVYFDSVDVTNPTSGSDGQSNQTSAMADSFTTGTPNFSQMSLTVSADNPADGGSTSVYLVPNTGGSPGVAGSPTVTLSGGNFVSFSGAELIGNIADSSVATTGAGTSLVTFNISPAQAALTTTNGEYWVGLVPTSNSTLDWYYGGASNGIGETNQENFYANTAAGGGGTGLVLDTGAASTSPPYDLIVDTPEPASLAILGSGLAALGYFRRRWAKKG